MTLHLSTLGFRANDPLRLAGFWAIALGWEVRDVNSDEVRLVPTDGTRFDISFSPSSAKKQAKNCIHIDLTTSSLDDQSDTVRALEKLGASRIDIGQGPDATHIVMADPEGNEFCVIEPDNSFLAGTGRLGSITCDGSPAVGHFWSAALGWPLVWDQDEETAIRASDGTGPFITWGPPVPPQVTNQLHFEIVPRADGDQLAEADRLVSLEARRVESGQGDSSNVVMTDPDGNMFHILTPR